MSTFTDLFSQETASRIADKAPNIMGVAEQAAKGTIALAKTTANGTAAIAIPIAAHIMDKVPEMTQKARLMASSIKQTAAFTATAAALSIGMSTTAMADDTEAYKTTDLGSTAALEAAIKALDKEVADAELDTLATLVDDAKDAKPPKAAVIEAPAIDTNVFVQSAPSGQAYTSDASGEPISNAAATTPAAEAAQESSQKTPNKLVAAFKQAWKNTFTAPANFALNTPPTADEMIHVRAFNGNLNSGVAGELVLSGAAQAPTLHAFSSSEVTKFYAPTTGDVTVSPDIISISYEVASGNTLSGIVADQCNISDRAQIAKITAEVAEENGIKDKNKISVGQHIAIQNWEGCKLRM